MGGDKDLDKLLAQYEQCAEDKRYFDNLLWQHLWRMFAISGILVGIASADAIPQEFKFVILAVAVLWAYVSTIAFSKCYFFLEILTNALTYFERKKLGTKCDIPRCTEDIKNRLKEQRASGKQATPKTPSVPEPSLPFQLKSTPKIAFWSMWFSCAFMVSLLLYVPLNWLIPCLPRVNLLVAIGCVVFPIHVGFLIYSEFIRRRHEKQEGKASGT